ncbi:DUF6443 domain-containing protein [Chryseobacterium populi]|uniref:RHS repeat-associated core domain protein containing protein n=1 Tax=Chryseobacterium populi TaxID=1144316 RepID=J3CKF5_9FLAO|nr:DUF6443 domain-containing protein [Chryseobacterium populi]EJL73321.1 RHS repeat-associated core domain protein containing protein [Chryseobacterium populi]
MKKIIIPISTLFVAGLFSAQTTVPSTTENYIYTKTYLNYTDPSDPTQTLKTSETVQYFDGLGRPKQVVNVKASPLGKDVVTHIEYDGFGRQLKDYLPVPQSQTLNGAIIPNPLANVVNTPYGSEKIYSEKSLEKSPLDRILQQKQVGNAWNNNPVQFGYDFNIDGEVKKYTTSTVWTDKTTISSISASGTYAANQLYKNTITDEDGNVSTEFKNGRGQTILIRKNDGVQNIDTYYVYDNYQNLAYVIPPLASISSTIDDTLLNNLCYQYRYDIWDRLVEKKLPGKGWEYMVYDKQDRLIMSQDTNMKASGNWLFTKYDKFSRVVYTGIADIGAQFSRGQVQSSADYYIDQGQPSSEERNTTGFTNSGMTVYYGNAVYPTTVAKVLSINYYDTYPTGTPTIPTQVLSQNVLPQNAQSSNVSTKSLPVASYVKNIEDDNWTKAYTWYDMRGRVIGTHSINHLGGYTKTENKLDFAGVPQKVNTTHLRKQGEIGVTVQERFVYDNQNRLKQHFHQVDAGPEELLVENTYNELSQLSNKKVGNNLQSIDYAYNIRGWLTDINKNQMSVANLSGKLFAYKIKYNQKEGITNPDTVLFPGKNVVAKYNGNIAEVDWRAVETIGQNPSLTPKRYGYAYDPLNRLTAGYYQNPNNPNSKENIESLTYDLNGNISKLYRTSVLQGTIATKIDDLGYTYSGNRVTAINDASQNSTGYEGGGATVGYDLNGNMTSMSDKGISSIKYNFLNLPDKLDYSKSEFEAVTLNTKYGADGSKLQKENITSVSGIAGTNTTKRITDYLDGFQYFKIEAPGSGGGSTESLANLETSRALEMQAYSVEPMNVTTTLESKNPDLQFFPTAEGFYDYTKNQYIYQYKDHLGNVRISFAKGSTDVLEITDSNDYYPFGMNHLKTGNSFFSPSAYKSYKYNGKELQESGMYDYGARMYMADIGRWGVVDPLAEKYRRWSPYNYTINDPINHIDPDGMDVVETPSGISYTGEHARAAFSSLQNSMRSKTPPNEYEVDLKTGKVKQVSDLGGNDIDFYHYTGGGPQFNGRTRIVDRETGEDQWMSSSKNIKGYNHRGNNVDWSLLYDEFLNGTGPEKSLLIGKESSAVKKLLNTQIYLDAATDFMNTSMNEKTSYAASFGPWGAVRENINAQGQFMGKTNFSFYPVGKKVVIMAFDSKSVSSYSFNPLNKGEERNIPRSQGIKIPQSTTHQTYIWWTQKNNLFK